MSYNNDNRPKADPAVASGIVVGFAVLAALPFFAVGIGLIVSGIKDLSYSAVFGLPKLTFGVIWNLTLIIMVISMVRISKRAGKTASEASDRIKTSSDPDPRFEKKDSTATSPSYDTGYQASEYIDPRNDPRFDYEWMKHDDCEADHKDDEDSVMKGYE